MNETLFRNGRFIDPVGGIQSVGDALLQRNGKIVCVGALSDVAGQATSAAQQVNLDGLLAVPGIVDAHMHLESLGQSQCQCALDGTADVRQALARLRDYAGRNASAPAIEARGFNLNMWSNPSYPTAAQLDEAVPNRPCIARAFDMHGAWANTAAMKKAGITADTQDPAGGRIIRDSHGRPSGYFLESAIALLAGAIPALSSHQQDEYLRAGVDEMVRRGHTGIHEMSRMDASTAVNLIARLHRLFPDGSLPLRVRLFISDANDTQAILAGRADDMVRIAGVKAFMDGSLGSRTAWLSEPFLDGSGTGIPRMSGEELRDRIRLANTAGLPLACHAIGDRAVTAVLEAFCDVGIPSIGNRIEHAQMVRPEDIPLFARAGVTASVQPGHIWTDWQSSDRLLGTDRSNMSFPLCSLLESGASLAMGSDAPIVPPDLGASLQAATLRTDGDGHPAGGWRGPQTRLNAFGVPCPSQRITVRQWAVAASYGGWFSIREHEHRGRLFHRTRRCRQPRPTKAKSACIRRRKLLPGMDCDLTLLADDIFSQNFLDYRHLRISGTVSTGRLVWRK